MNDSGFISVADLTPVVAVLRNFGLTVDLTQPTDPPLSTPPFIDVTGDDVAAVSDLLAVVTPLRAGIGLPAPVLEGGLANDTGTPGDGVTSNPAIAGRITANLAPETRLVGRLDDGPFFLIDLGPTGSFLHTPSLPQDGSADGPHTYHLFAQTAGGEVATVDVSFTFEAAPDDSIRLAEESEFVVEETRRIELGQTAGSRTLRFDIDAAFDTADAAAAIEDTLLVYVVDPNDRGNTLLDRGENGTALFALSGDQAEFPRGLVAFDGGTVEIDLTDLGHLFEAELVLQLINSDDDEGTEIVVGPFVNEVDLLGAANPRSLTAAHGAAIGPALDLAGLSPAPDISVELANVRLSEAGRYAAELRVRNDGAATGRTVAVVFPGLPEGVTRLIRQGVRQWKLKLPSRLVTIDLITHRPPDDDSSGSRRRPLGSRRS
ncbi:MAG: hypothetical protein KY475_16140 [Planctomycetes bacterium]|nr:hypothetical protein [Planctomycetota bacterium]